MKNWFRNKIKNFIFPSDEEAKIGNSVYVTEDDTQITRDNTLKFTVTPARGGVIVQIRAYDPKRDEHDWVTHVIHEDENVSGRVAEIVSMSLLRA